jgi:hypothetical protein
VNGWPSILAWTFHFTPTSASWLNAVEGFFAKLTSRRLKRGVIRQLEGPDAVRCELVRLEGIA